jgi:hypothetical protein
MYEIVPQTGVGSRRSRATHRALRSRRGPRAVAGNLVVLTQAAYRPDPELLSVGRARAKGGVFGDLLSVTNYAHIDHPELKVKRMRATAIILAVGLLLVGCAETARPIFLCPQACKPFVGDWISLRECLFKQDGGYWLTDSSGRALESYRYRHGSGVLPITTTRENQDHISTPILLKRNTTGAVLHLIYGGAEQSISIGCSTAWGG